MRIQGITLFIVLFGVTFGEKENKADASEAFMEAARALFSGSNNDAIGGFQGVANAFMQSDAGKQVGDILGNEKSKTDAVGEILSGIGHLLSGSKQDGGVDLSSILQTVSSSMSDKEDSNEIHKDEPSMNFESILNVANMFISQGSNADGLMGIFPMVLDSLSSDNSYDGKKRHDHSDHSWWLPPILENVHVMWEHFSNSELGRTLWKNSGLANIVGQMTDAKGHLQYERILDSFENPQLRRRWVKSFTNFVAESISHVADPVTQQRYLGTIQFVGNTFLKSQGFPKSVMFEPSRPAESLSRLINAVAKRHLNMNVDSSQYIKPAVAYIQELMNLATEKGFIVSRINARELSNKLSNTINNDIIGPLLKAYRGYKWATKMPHCATHILCTINNNNNNSEDDGNNSQMRSQITKIASFPAAWAISNKASVNFWSLYGSIVENKNCAEKYPVDCSAFHEEELRVTTEYSHNEL